MANRYARDMVMRGRRDMRNPYGSRGGYVSSRRPRRDRAMEDMARGMYNDYADMDYARGGRGNRGGRGRDYGDYNDYDMRGGDYGLHEGYHNVGIDPNYPRYDQDMRGGDYGTYAIRGEYDGRMSDYGYEDMRMRDYGYDMARRGGRGMRRDYGDYADYGDYGEEVKLSKHDMEKWKKELHNNDGSNGEHFRKEQIEQMAKQWGTDVNKYGGADVFAMTMNMMYSDYCSVAKKYGVDRPEYYSDLAKAFLDDKDFDGEGAEKLALYYKCIVEKDED